jgi:hypothetical protein
MATTTRKMTTTMTTAVATTTTTTVKEEEMKRQSAVTSGEGGVSRGAGEGGSDMSDRGRMDQHATAAVADDNDDITIAYDVRRRKKDDTGMAGGRDGGG